MPKFIDLTGKTFGYLTVIKRVDNSMSNRSQYECLCKCGSVVVVASNNLSSSHTKSCGCLAVELASKLIKDLAGKRFGKLVALKIARASGKRVSWLCQCDCGNTCCVAACNLIGNSKNTKGKTKSCGCYRRDFRKKPSEQVGFIRLIESYRRNAKNKGISFELSEEQFKMLTKENCHYCGLPPSSIIKPFRSTQENNGGYLYNGVDRVNSDVGYIIENCVTCCRKCNLMKNKLRKEEFLSHVISIAQFQLNNGSLHV